MQRSEQIGDLMSALSKAQLEFGAATKDSKNPFYGSSYADLASVIGAVRPALNKHGIAILHDIESDLERQTAAATVYLHKGEQWISLTQEAPAVGKSKDGKDRFDVQTIGAVWTYLRRYGAQAITGIASEDDDGNSVVRDDAKPVPAKAKANPTPPAQTAPVEPEAKVETGIRSQFFSKAKEFGWGLADIKKYILQEYPDAAGSTTKMSEQDLNDSLAIMGANKPAEVLKAQEAA